MPEKDAAKRSAQRAIDAKLYDRAVGNPIIKVFERVISQRLGDVLVLATNGKAGALVMALETLGIGPGDEVIIPAFCSPITTSSLLSVGATPVFVDIRLCDYAIDPAKIEKKITVRTKAIIVVHLFGQPALGTGEVLEIAKRNLLPVIENAAQAFGARIRIDGKQRLVGTLGDIGCFTFFSTTPFTNSNSVSVMVLQSKEKLYAIAKKLRSARASSLPRETEAPAILARLNFFDEQLEQRRRLAKYYTQQLSGISGITLPESYPETENVWYRYAIRAEKREALLEHFSQKLSASHRPHPTTRLFALEKRHILDDFPISKQAASEIIFLPVFMRTSLEDAAMVAQSIRTFFQR
ncbi:MAG: DegT/DnrJ/EryC1/StrS family aminotransferase [Candidatus Moranbacteria bacterium]|nr:DegT/DnrJ/EryC1/StrS family aminotransferase [Candidatus Moranbacteria bacterium]